MPMSMFDLSQERKTTTLFDGKLNLTYRPHKLTPARELAMLRASEGEVTDKDPAALAKAKAAVQRQLQSFAELVEAWDFLGPLAEDTHGDSIELPPFRPGDDLELASWLEENHPGAQVVVNIGDPVPLEPRYLRLISSQFLMLIIAELNEDMRPNVRRRDS